MAEITAGMVKELREKTDAPMMECKKALTEAAGDLEKAEEILRVKLGNKASKAASRVAAEGVVALQGLKRLRHFLFRLFFQVCDVHFPTPQILKRAPMCPRLPLAPRV